MSETDSAFINFKQFSPLTTPLVHKFRIAQQKNTHIDEISNFSSDAESTSLFLTQSKIKKPKVIKQTEFIDSVISSLGSADSYSDSDENSENVLLHPTQQVRKGPKKLTKTMKPTPDFIDSDLSDMYSEENSSMAKMSPKSPVKHFSVSPVKSDKNSQSRKGKNSPVQRKSSSSELGSSESEEDLKVDATSTLSKRKTMSPGSSSSVTSESELDDNNKSGSKNSRKLPSKAKSKSKLENKQKQRRSSSDSESDFDDGKKSTLKKVQSVRGKKSSSKSKPVSTQKHKTHSASDSESSVMTSSDLETENVKNLSSTKTSVNGKRQNLSLKKPTSSAQKGKTHFQSDSESSEIMTSDSEANSPPSSPVIPVQNAHSVIPFSGKQGTGQRRKVQRFQCPEGFEETDAGPRSLTVKKAAKKEFWLIKTPLDFDISSLDGTEVPLNGFNKLPTTEVGKQFEVMAIPQTLEKIMKMSTLLVNGDDASLVVGSSFAGQIHVMESVATLPLAEIQAQPKGRHQLPSNLRQRYVPFGADSPAQTVGASQKTKEKKSKKRKSEDKGIETGKKKKKKSKKSVD